MATSNVTLSVQHGQSIAFSAYGIILKQKEVVTVVEERGYTTAEAAAAAAAAAFSDSTGQTTLYHPTSGGGFVMAAVMTGSLTTAVAHRVNEANMFSVTKTTTAYSYTAPSGSSWTATRPAAGNGFASSSSRARRILTEISGYALIATETSTTIEWRGCTPTEAALLLANCPQDSLTDHEYKCVRIATELGRFTAQTGTRYNTQTRYISDAEGWSVSRTQTTITVSGTNWSVA